MKTTHRAKNSSSNPRPPNHRHRARRRAGRTGAAACAEVQGRETTACIATPDSVTTRATARWRNALTVLPIADTVQKVYDNLGFGRGVEAFLAGMPAASGRARVRRRQPGRASRESRASASAEALMDARSLFLTPNSTRGLHHRVPRPHGRTDAPAGAAQCAAAVDDAYFRFVTDVGLVGPDQGKGGKYQSSGLCGHPSRAGILRSKSPAYSQMIFYRAFVQGGDIAAAVTNIEDTRAIYPLSAAAPSAHANACQRLGHAVQHDPRQRLSFL